MSRRARSAALALIGALAVAVPVAARPSQDPPEQGTLSVPVGVPPAPAPTVTPQPIVPAVNEGVDLPIAWRPSRPLGLPFRGRLVDGVQLPASGRDFFTWDPPLKRSPNRPWRRWGTDRLVRMLLTVLREYRAEHPWAPRVGVGDLSRTNGGEFGARFGGLGHASHQNGLDVDVYYPRLDATERRPYRPDQVDVELAQDLVDRFVAADAQYVFVGPRLPLDGPRKVVRPLRYHDDHMHVRIRKG